MKTVRRQNSSLRSLAVACAFLFALVLPASAVKTPDVISRATIARLYYADGSVADLFNGHGNGLDELFDNNFADTNAVYVAAGDHGASIVLEFPSLPEINHDANKGVYVSEIRVGHVSNCAWAFSLYWSDTVTNKTTTTLTWHPVEGAQNVVVPGVTNFPVKSRALYVKYVFNTTGSDSLCELQVKGWVSEMPRIISDYRIASFHNADGSAMTANGGGGNNWGGAERSAQRMFDNNFTSYQMWPKAGQNGYVMVDFTSTNGPAHLNEYYVTELWVGADGTKKFTLQFSEDGSTWQNVDGAAAVTCNGIGKFAVGKIAKAVRYVWTDDSYNNFSDEYLAEFQAWGIDPVDAPCTHPSYTEWGVSVPATCTERAILSRFCTECDEEFTKTSTDLPLGHDYVTTLDRPGHFSQRKDFPDNRRYGTGSITCSRCNFRLDFPKALDLVTNRVDGKTICGMKTEGIVRFTDVSVSSENNPQWGPGGKKIIDGVWNTSQEWPYWTTASTNAQYADFSFGTTIDLTEIEFSVYNHGYHLEFSSVDDDTEEETKFGEINVAYDENFLVTKKVKQTVVDPDTGEEIEIEVEKEVTADYQRVRVPFFETPVKHLRVRIVDEEPIDLWSCKGIRVIEIHPWGTVPGASDFETSKTTLIIFK